MHAARLVRVDGNVLDARQVFARRNEHTVTKAELAHHLSISTSTVDRYVRQGMPYQPLPAAKRFYISECEDWLARNS